jgi:hypothetical protein
VRSETCYAFSGENRAPSTPRSQVTGSKALLEASEALNLTVANGIAGDPAAIPGVELGAAERL